MKKLLVFVTILSIGLSCFCQDENKIIASVNNEIITLNDLDEYVGLFSAGEDTDPKELRAQVLGHIIKEKLILTAALKEDFRVPQNWVDEKVDELKKSYPTKEEFEKSLTQKGLTTTMMRKKIENNFLMRTVVEKYVNSKVIVSPKDITDYYYEHIDQYSSDKKYICWIAKSNKKSFLELVGQKIKDSGIEAVIDEYGELFFKIESEKEGMKKEIKEVIDIIKEDEYKIKEIEGAYYLVYLKTIVPAYKKFIDEVKDEIHSLLWKEKFDQKLDEWVAQLKEDAVIKIYD